MTDRATLLALADLVEAASGPDRELNVEIFRSLGHEVEWRPANYTMELQPVINWKAPHVCAGMKEPCPKPTASLDAALSLVPEGWRVNTSDWSIEGQYRWILRGPCLQRVPNADGGWDAGDDWFVGAMSCATPALALTAAALRALAQEAPSYRSASSP